MVDNRYNGPDHYEGPIRTSGAGGAVTVPTRFSPGFGPSKNTDWGTPRALFEELHGEFDFTVDAAASAANALLPRFWDEAADGLRQSWHEERVYCNPPYGKGLGLWCRKAAERRAEVAVLLVPSRTCASWWHDWVWPCAEIRFVRGRLSFVGGSGRAPFPSAVLVYRGGK